MVDELLKNGEKSMDEVIIATKKAFAAIRTGRANPGLLDRITVDYYGTPTPLHQLAGISAPEARLLVIQPWDKAAMKDIERAILASDLGLTPTNDGNVIRLGIPQLTEERRKQLVKVVKKEAEDHKIAIRNIRRELNEEVKKMEKDGDISEDESRRVLNEVQALTNRFVADIDAIVDLKEKEILEI